MKNYYDEIIESIKEHIEEKEIDNARALILSELKMPYIPKEFEEMLHELMSEVKEQTDTVSTGKLSIDEIEKYLFENDQKQLIAVNELNGMNLRSQSELCAQYFKSGPSVAAAALLIDSCIEQQLEDTFTYVKDEVEFNFSPILCERPFDSLGFKEAQRYLALWFESEDPSFFELCMQQLIHECFFFLPLSYDFEEGYELALQVSHHILCLMGREDEWEIVKNGLLFQEDTKQNQYLS